MKNLKRYRTLLLMTMPALIYLLINNYLPMFGIIIAFKDLNFSKGIWGSDWVGFANFEYLFRTADAFLITRNTLLYNTVFIVLGTILSVGAAILLNEVKQKLMSRFYQSIILMPFLISMVIVAYLGIAMLDVENGFLNRQILPLLGIEPISWYGEPKYWPYILTIINMWKSVGYSSIIYFAAVIGIDHEYYEAATIDGASRWQQILKITIPLIMPIITVLVLLSIGRIFYSDFGLFYQVPLNSGALQSTTDVLDTYVFRALMTLGDFGMASAAALYQSFVGFILVVLANYVVSKRSKDQALF
ncbi:ABC transporter permease subunit [Paenibacillus sp. FSL H8-0548]|uniref:ABC transporter permease n=1 Tax=Paenibacillus sp. FSL H8-0548 TaxID=1920422 RepID=UPI002115D15A|nr:ABC transporter permease subunit [Paenibacillus sp. FSL H8-0548]